jgi:hypothetical protein
LVAVGWFDDAVRKILVIGSTDATKAVGWLKGLLAACILTLALMPTSALAIPITYTFVGTISGRAYGPNPVPFGGPTLVVTDVAVAAGSLDFHVGPGSCPSPLPGLCIVTGDPTGFSSFGYVIPDFFGDPLHGAGIFNIDVAFNPDGTLSGSIFEAGTNSDFNISGGEFAWSGTFSSDASLCDASTIGGGCTLSGYWQTASVPESPSIWLFGGGLLMLLLLGVPRLWSRA